MGRLRINLLLYLCLYLSFGCVSVAETQPTVVETKPTPEVVETRPRPADFSLQYHWSEGALPPPYHYEYTLYLGPGSTGVIEFWPDYRNPDTPVWTETFELKEGELDKLYALLQAKGLLEEQEWQSQEPAPGAPGDGLQVTVEGRQLALPGYVEGEAGTAVLAEVFEVIKRQVPEPIWAKLMEQYEQYQADFLAEEAASTRGSSAPTPTPTGIPAGTNEKIKTDDFEGVIFSAENAATTGVVNWGETYWTPSQAEVLVLESQLGPYLQETAPQDYPGPLRDLSEYKRQYVGILVNGQQVIFVNFFCNADELDWSREFVLVDDGGSCYFEVKYNLETGKFSGLSIHGEA